MSPVLELRGGRVERGGRTVLAGVDVAIAGGRITALVGDNGAGKSSLLAVLAGIEPLAAGTLRLDDRTISGEDGRAELRRRVALVQQNPYLLSGSVADNVALGLRLRGVPRRQRQARAREVMDWLGIGPLATRPARELSGGEVQRVAIARMLALSPEVLLLDEPFTHLDEAAVAELETLLGTLGEHGFRTVLFSTHDRLRARALADECVLIAGGRAHRAGLGNLFRGRLDPAGHRFDTGRLTIAVPEAARSATHAVVDPDHVVLSRERLPSSMRNAFAGRVTALRDLGDAVEVTVDAGERFVAHISHAALAEQAIGAGTPVWVSFKASAVQVF